MAPRSEQLQIRVTRREKAVLKRLARAAGQDVSGYVLSRALPSEEGRLAGVVEALRDDTNRRFALAELNDVLSSLAPTEFAAAVGPLDVRGLGPVVQNYVTVMVEQAARAKASARPRGRAMLFRLKSHTSPRR